MSYIYEFTFCCITFDQRKKKMFLYFFFQLIGKVFMFKINGVDAIQKP